MFGFGRKEGGAAVAPRPVGPQPMEAAAPLEAGELDAYVRTALAVGLESPAVRRAQLLLFLRDARIPVYDNAAVFNWMQEKSADKQWYWFALRPKDAQVRAIVQWGETKHSAGWGHPPYAKAVPLRVLARVERIQEALPWARFFVTDYAARQPDPFLCVAIDGMEPVVVDFWDEPGFKG